MSNVILGLLTRTETAPAILNGAERLAILLHDARIEALVARVDPISTIMLTEEVMPKPEERRIRAREAERAAALHRIYEVWAARHGGLNGPRWIDEEGATEALVKNWGERADYIVVGRPDAHAEHAEQEALHAALFVTGRPVLLMPSQASTFGRTLAIAWRDDRFTLNAVLAALRCLPQAEEVHLLMGRREGQPPPKIPEVLADHGISVIEHDLPIGENPLGAQIMATVHEVKADVLVMGAFVHSAWRNMMFGGVTRYILDHADLPVLMRH